MQLSHLHYVVDIDIKGFFDNVNHGKLLKQMWTMGIRDKKLLSIISAMLKAEVAGIGFPEVGTPQGGIISPLLSNIVLNELDWWLASQWEEIRQRFFPNLRLFCRPCQECGFHRSFSCCGMPAGYFQAGLSLVVDIDIKGFFDNVNHGKLLKQMWTMGIRDKKLLTSG